MKRAFYKGKPTKAFQKHLEALSYAEKTICSRLDSLFKHFNISSCCGSKVKLYSFEGVWLVVCDSCDGVIRLYD